MGFRSKQQDVSANGVNADVRAGSSVNGFEKLPEYRATIGYKLLHAGVFAGLVVAVVALNVGWFQFGPQNLRQLTEYYDSPFQPVWWAYYLWVLIWGLQLVALLDLFLLTRCGFQSPKKGRVLHAIDVYWIAGWLCTIGWILTTQYPLDNKGALWAGFGFWVATMLLFGFSMLRMHAFKGWFNPWYWVVYLGSTSMYTAWSGIMLMVAILDLMRRYNSSFNLIQGFGYGIFSAYVVIGLLLAIFARDFFYPGVIIFAAITIYINRINYDASNTAITVYMWCMVGVLAVAILIGLLMVCCVDTPRAMRNRKDRRASASSDIESGAEIKPEPAVVTPPIPVNGPLAATTEPGVVASAQPPSQFVTQ